MRALSLPAMTPTITATHSNDRMDGANLIFAWIGRWRLARLWLNIDGDGYLGCYCREQHTYIHTHRHPHTCAQMHTCAFEKCSRFAAAADMMCHAASDTPLAHAVLLGCVCTCPGNAATKCRSACIADELTDATTPNGDLGIDGMFSVMAHEITEAASDPQITTWLDLDGNENAGGQPAYGSTRVHHGGLQAF